MGLWDTLRRWFGGNADEENAATTTTRFADQAAASNSIEAEADAALATLEQAGQENQPPWWVPRGTPVTSAPKASQTISALDRTLYDYLAKVLDAPDLELPRLPQVAMRALNLLREESVNNRSLA